jgi:hypothetical protein
MRKTHQNRLFSSTKLRHKHLNFRSNLFTLQEGSQRGESRSFLNRKLNFRKTSSSKDPQEPTSVFLHPIGARQISYALQPIAYLAFNNRNLISEPGKLARQSFLKRLACITFNDCFPLDIARRTSHLGYPIRNGDILN